MTKFTRKTKKNTEVRLYTWQHLAVIIERKPIAGISVDFHREDEEEFFDRFEYSE